jgi:hypothetical protein
LFVDFDTAQFEESAGEAVADCLLVRSSKRRTTGRTTAASASSPMI